MSEEIVKFKSVDKLIEFIDSNILEPKKLRNKVLHINGNEVDSVRLIKRYNLQVEELLNYSSQQSYIWAYQTFRDCLQPRLNTFATGPASMYGNYITKLNINNIQVEISKSPKTNYDDRFSSKAVDLFSSEVTDLMDKKIKYLVLDIETTGLDPLVDDVIQICIFENDNNKYVRYLPLEKKKTNTAIDINHISNNTLKAKMPLTQKDVDEIIEKFDVRNKLVVIWTGKNLFDRLFLEIYFKEHNLTGLEHFTFFNAKTIIDSIKYKMQVRDLSKDNISRIYGLNNHDAHDALNDCKVEKQIVEKLLNGETEPLMSESEGLFYSKFIEFMKGIEQSTTIVNISPLTCNFAKYYYECFCDLLRGKYGIVINDYDKPHKGRGAEWIDIHHIDETELDNIAVRTELALRMNDKETLTKLSKYNKSKRLIYANKIEHFILHILIDLIRLIPSGGPHFTFGSILKLEIGKFKEGTKEYKLQSQKAGFYKYISFEELLQMYIKIARITLCKDTFSLHEFWKLNYDYDENKYKEICEKINKELAE